MSLQLEPAVRAGLRLELSTKSSQQILEPRPLDEFTKKMNIRENVSEL